jgi:hypothetical protein
MHPLDGALVGAGSLWHTGSSSWGFLGFRVLGFRATLVKTSRHATLQTVTATSSVGTRNGGCTDTYHPGWRPQQAPRNSSKDDTRTL